jgi:thiamine biosynthesis protein ThiI
LKNPDIELFIEIRENNSYIFTEKIIGTGGFPIHSQGKIIAIITDLQSLLASWYLMKRGCGILFVLIDDKINEDTVNSFLSNWYAKSKIIKVSGGFEQFKKELLDLSYENKYDAIVTGHSFLKNNIKETEEINLFKSTLNLPILNPLLSMTELEIKKKCMEIELQL